MSTPQSIFARRVRWLALDVGVWSGLALLFALQSEAMREGGPSLTFGKLLAIQLAGWLPCALLTPAVGWLALRVPLSGLQRGRAVLVHVAGAVAFAVVGGMIMGSAEFALPFLHGEPTLAQAALDGVVRYFVWDLMVYVMIVAAFTAIASARALREREVAAAQLQAQLAEARLHVLTAQLQPHFLFNTLHAISALVHDDPKQADRLLARLSDLLRHSLRSGSRVETTLDEELAFLEKYVDIQEARFGDRLRVTFQVDQDVSEARVPQLLLQPLVENAIRHGISRRAARGCVELTARQESGRLLLTVRDDGIGLPPNGTMREGIGLSTTRARLQQLYGDDHDFAIADVPGGGAAVTLRIPFRTMVREVT